jgi:CHAT domain-containing protein
LEVSALDLSQVDTVVLSACETGLGQVAGGEGLLGLQRAFQIAGAKTVVASLWKVDDQSTQLLMKEFYDNLWKRNLGKLESLRQAQIKLLREGVTWQDPSSSRGLTLEEEQPPLEGQRLPPFYWAAFVLSGDWR